MKIEELEKVVRCIMEELIKKEEKKGEKKYAWWR